MFQCEWKESDNNLHNFINYICKNFVRADNIYFFMRFTKSKTGKEYVFRDVRNRENRLLLTIVKK